MPSITSITVNFSDDTTAQFVTATPSAIVENAVIKESDGTTETLVPEAVEPVTPTE